MEHGKRGGRFVRERVALRKALEQVSEPCPFCLDAVGVSSWNRESARWRIVIFHSADCPVPGNRSLEMDVESYTRSVIQLYGIQAAADYNEHLLIESHLRGSWG